MRPIRRAGISGARFTAVRAAKDAVSVLSSKRAWFGFFGEIFFLLICFMSRTVSVLAGC
jgi:hypothetical protein